MPVSKCRPTTIQYTLHNYTSLRPITCRRNVTPRANLHISLYLSLAVRWSMCREATDGMKMFYASDDAAISANSET